MVAARTRQRTRPAPRAVGLDRFPPAVDPDDKPTSPEATTAGFSGSGRSLSGVAVAGFMDAQQPSDAVWIDDRGESSSFKRISTLFWCFSFHPPIRVASNRPDCGRETGHSCEHTGWRSPTSKVHR